MTRDFDLIELHVYGGPWTEDEAEAFAKRLIEAMRPVIRMSGSVHVADIRGEDREDRE